MLPDRIIINKERTVPEHRFIVANDAGTHNYTSYLEKYLNDISNSEHNPNATAFIVGNAYLFSTIDKIPFKHILSCDIEPKVGDFLQEMRGLIIACYDNKSLHWDEIKKQIKDKVVYYRLYQPIIIETFDKEIEQLGDLHFLSSRERFNQIAERLKEVTIIQVVIDLFDEYQVEELRKQLVEHKIDIGMFYLTNVRSYDGSNKMSLNLSRLPRSATQQENANILWVFIPRHVMFFISKNKNYQLHFADSFFNLERDFIGLCSWYESGTREDCYAFNFFDTNKVLTNSIENNTPEIRMHIIAIKKNENPHYSTNISKEIYKMICGKELNSYKPRTTGLVDSSAIPIENGQERTREMIEVDSNTYCTVIVHTHIFRIEQSIPKTGDYWTDHYLKTNAPFDPQQVFTSDTANNIYLFVLPSSNENENTIRELNTQLEKYNSEVRTIHQSSVIFMVMTSSGQKVTNQFSDAEINEAKPYSVLSVSDDSSITESELASFFNQVKTKMQLELTHSTSAIDMNMQMHNAL